MPKNGFVYILTNLTNSILCTGVAVDLAGRIRELRRGTGADIMSQHKATKLVYFETARSIRSANERERQIRKDSRRKKLDLIDAMNPEWRDLADDITRQRR